VRALFTLTVFVGSALVFLVQPMIAKMILPRFGGTPAVWNASVLFFQAALLAGYAYAHWSVRAFGVRRQSMAHLVLVALAMLTLPFALPAAGAVPVGGPALQLLGLLAIVVGPAFFVVSAGAPLIQRWYAATPDPRARDPYFLYSASNVGSMLALLSYPFLMEPALRLGQQAEFWTWGYRLLAVLLLLCAGVLWKVARPVGAGLGADAALEGDASAPPVTRDQRVFWTLGSAIPAMLLLAVTTHITTDLAPMPLLWVVPLALYLLTFIIAFSSRNLTPLPLLGRAVPMVVTPLALVIVLQATEPVGLLAAVHLLAFFAIAWMCHGRLSASRPEPRHLTEFYLWIAVGGVLGGAFVTLLAPLIFNTLAEYPLAIVLACMLRPARPEDSDVRRWDLLYPLGVALITAGLILSMRMIGMEATGWRTVITIGIPAVLVFLAVDRPMRYALALGGLFVASLSLHAAADGTVLLNKRSFFGVHRVQSRDGGQVFELIHGNTVHGRQDRRRPHVPLTYYHPDGPIGEVFEALEGDPRRREVALVGLGVGSLAAYGRDGERMVYYEIDPDVVRIARNPNLFTFLHDSMAQVDVVLGDARLRLEDAPDGRYGLIVLDAFSSDSIPVHLMTREAVALYLDKLAPNGILAMHISNRYLELEGVVGRIAQSHGLVAFGQYDVADAVADDEGRFSSNWMILARRQEDLAEVLASRRWLPAAVGPTDPLWTDDFSNIMSVFARE
jgi:SAM-dependent methyltransferase